MLESICESNIQGDVDYSFGCMPHPLAILVNVLHLGALFKRQISATWWVPDMTLGNCDLKASPGELSLAEI